MIKEGDVFKSKHSKYKMVVTAVGTRDFFLIHKDGSSRRYSYDQMPMLLERAEKIASYETWPQAVNSKEFQNE